MSSDFDYDDGPDRLARLFLARLEALRERALEDAEALLARMEPYCDDAADAPRAGALASVRTYAARLAGHGAQR
jgi:hypothetical protein